MRLTNDYTAAQKAVCNGDWIAFVGGYGIGDASSTGKIFRIIRKRIFHGKIVVELWDPSESRQQQKNWEITLYRQNFLPAPVERFCFAKFANTNSGIAKGDPIYLIEKRWSKKLEASQIKNLSHDYRDANIGSKDVEIAAIQKTEPATKKVPLSTVKVSEKSPWYSFVWKIFRRTTGSMQTIN